MLPATSEAPRRRRGRPAGAKDTKPRKRRSKAEIGAEPVKAKPVREGQIQAQFIKWLESVPAPGVPGGKLGHYTFAVPNGIWIPGPLEVRMRIIVTQRRQGLKKGVPDVHILFPLHRWHGCIIELKRDERGLMPSNMDETQVEWLNRCKARGYFVEICAGLTAACEAVGRYLNGCAPLPFPWEVE